MEIDYSPSAADHGISREDAIWAITHAVGRAEIEGHPGEETHVFVGRPHEQSNHYIEVMVAKTARGDLRIFHATELRDQFAYLVGE